MSSCNHLQWIQTACSNARLTALQTALTALFPGLPRWAGTRKVKPIRKRAVKRVCVCVYAWVLIKVLRIDTSAWSSKQSDTQYLKDRIHGQVVLNQSNAHLRGRQNHQGQRNLILDGGSKFPHRRHVLDNWNLSLNQVAPRGQRDYIPPTAVDSSLIQKSRRIYICERVRSTHISGGQQWLKMQAASVSTA